MSASSNSHALGLAALLLGACLAGGGPARADELKVGFVNIARVLQQAPQADDARQRIEREFALRNRDLVDQQREITQLEDELLEKSAVMSSSDRSRQEADIRSLKRDRRRSQDEFREDLNVRRNEELSKLQRLVLDVIQELARGENYDLVVSEGVTFASERVDITDKVISQLKASFKPGG